MSFEEAQNNINQQQSFENVANDPGVKPYVLQGHGPQNQGYIQQTDLPHSTNYFPFLFAAIIVALVIYRIYSIKQLRNK